MRARVEVGFGLGLGLGVTLTRHEVALRLTTRSARATTVVRVGDIDSEPSSVDSNR